MGGDMTRRRARESRRGIGVSGDARDSEQRRRDGPDAFPDSPNLAWRSAAATSIVLIAFAAIFIALSVNAFTRTSAAWDEPMHLTAGYAALAKHDYRLDPSHPPFLRMWAALPTLLDTMPMRAIPADDVPTTQWLQDAYGFAHRFLYVDNDADRLLYRARFMTVILGVVLGIFVFLWAREWLGPVPALIALACYTFEPNLFAHASLVTTDFGVTCFIFGAVYFAWLISRKFSFPRVAGLAACFSLALVSKFSAVLLGPVVLILLGISVRRRSAITPRRAYAIAAAIGLTTLTVIWASYGLRYLPAPSAASQLSFHDATAAHSTVDTAVAWIDSHRLLPNAYTQGFLYALTSVQRLPAFLAGHYSADGWWYYFPLAFLLKTPTPLIVLIATGLVIVGVRRRAVEWHDAVFVLLPIVVFVTAAMWTGINIGLRHILPVYPFLILLAAVGARDLIRIARRPRVIMLGALALIWTSEYAAAYPHALTFFNHAAGGPETGYRYLADSNLGWGQGLKSLKEWMHDAGVTHVNLAYFGQADPAYYGIDCTHLPGAPSFATEKVARPKLPGYVAISSTILTGVYSPPSWRLFYAPFRDLKPAAVVGNTIRIYWVETWPELDAPAAATTTADAHRSLADALLFGFRWSDHAVLHYRRYLDVYPANADVLVSYALALMGLNQVKESVAVLERAITIDPRHAAAHLVLGQLLLANGRLAQAAIEAERAVGLQPRNAHAHLLLGRVYAAQARLAESAREFARVIEIEPDHPEARDYARRVSDAQRMLRSGTNGVR
jgi:tetratricopeptide (TPR) repeat protein